MGMRIHEILPISRFSHLQLIHSPSAPCFMVPNTVFYTYQFNVFFRISQNKWMDGFAESAIHLPTQISVFNRGIFFLFMKWWFSCGFIMDRIISLGYFADCYNAWFSVREFDMPVYNDYANLHTHTLEMYDYI